VTAPRVLAVAGSLRQGSHNRKLLALAVRTLSEAGAEVDLVDLKAAALPVYDGDVESQGMPQAVVSLKDRILQAKALLIATPEYNHSIPGGLKNAIDWASRPPSPFRDKVALLMGATTGMGGTLYSQNHLREVLTALGVWLVPGSVSVSRAQEAFDERGELRDTAKREQIARLCAVLLEQAKV
jgi:chromate reductase, NAD(P)H dehydrogenase (quinone)